MDLKQLTALVTVADVGTVTKAAALLHLVQPAVTRQIRMLEEELDVQLFERTPQGMRPTPPCLILLEHARRALTELDRARAAVRPEPGVVTGIVGVGVLESVVDLVVVPLAAAIAERYPGIELRVMSAYSGHLRAWLDAGELDLSLLYNLTDTPSLSVAPLLDEELWVVGQPDAGLHPDHPVTWEYALSHPMVMPVPGHGLRILIDQARAERATEARIAIQTNSMSLQKKLVLSGHGWTILPAAGVHRDVSSGVLSGAPLVEPRMVRRVVLGLHRAGHPSPAVEAVATEIVRRLVRSGEWPAAETEGDVVGPRG